MAAGEKMVQEDLVEELMVWYRSQSRPLPWRETTDPYAIWVSEIMLQQTQVDTVIPYYRRFLERFPTVQALAAAPLESVLKLWENLGYYSRARHLHRAAGLVTTGFGGRIPDRWEVLIRLPGIGPYTAGAILSIAFAQPLPAIDGNVRRVVSRLMALEISIDEPPGQKWIEGVVRDLIPPKHPGLFNQALMELGALVCSPKSPACPCCPVRSRCRAFALDRTKDLPRRGRRRTVPHREVVAAIIGNGEGRVLIVRRPGKGLLASLWKFPGDILSPQTTTTEGIQGIVREELGLEIGVGERLASVDHAYTHFRITLSAYAGTIEKGSPVAREGQSWRWASASEMDDLPFSKADRIIARKVLPPG